MYQSGTICLETMKKVVLQNLRFVKTTYTHTHIIMHNDQVGLVKVDDQGGYWFVAVLHGDGNRK